MGSLGLRIRAAAVDAELAQRCRGLTTDVLERALHALELGQRHVLVRHLVIRWRVPDALLGASDLAERLAAEVAEALQPALRAAEAVSRPDPEDEVVVFADEAALWAAALLHRSTSATRPWFFAEVLAALGADAAAVWAHSPERSVQQLARALGWSAPGHLALDTPRSSPPSWPTAARSHAIGAPPPSDLTAEAWLSDLALHLAQERTRSRSEAPSGRREQRAEASAPSLRQPPAETASDPAPRVEAEPALTAFAGACAILRLWLDHAVPAHLYAACIDEGPFLAWALTAQLGADPLWEALAGGAIDAPTLQHDQLHDVVRAVQAELGAAGPQAPAWWQPPEAATDAQRLAQLLWGAALAAFEARLHEPVDDWSAFQQRFLAVPGRLERHDDAIVVCVDARLVDFDVRRAGLDRDPGYLPWLRSSLRLRYEGGEPGELPAVTP
ncbi:MAG: hypothetical protein KTR31_00565 [Myxococcales bacterium]|nr:hypothetical protein [Myxococcales bacterium]